MIDTIDRNRLTKTIVKPKAIER